MNIDHVEKAFLKHAWLEERLEMVEILKNNAVLTGSFSNPEMARKYIDDNKYESTENVEDVDIDKMNDIVGDDGDMPPIPHRRRRRIING